MDQEEDHPRSRGVYAIPDERLAVVVGSSPLARGLLLVLQVILHLARIIPARAGFTLRTHLVELHAQDHPRSRGVYPPPPPGFFCGVGSSPLARGLPNHHLPVLRRIRIIPARAGFTTRRIVLALLRRDHPRSRGVYASSSTTGTSSRGSSPLARGLRAGLASTRAGRRIIPARAGFTQNALISGGVHTDHPRSRGVYIISRDQ